VKLHRFVSNARSYCNHFFFISFPWHLHPKWNVQNVPDIVVVVANVTTDVKVVVINVLVASEVFLPFESIVTSVAGVAVVTGIEMLLRIEVLVQILQQK
jgi:hypothetical protein